MSEHYREDVKIVLWDDFCRQRHIREHAVPLFLVQDGCVATRACGANQRVLVQRAPQMEALVIGECTKVLHDFAVQAGVYDGLIYMMFWSMEDRVLPLYIGKSEKIGRRGGNLSANIRNIATNRGKFCRWGDNYAYHIGDLSAVVCPHHPPSTIDGKYRKWADRLFAPDTWPSTAPRLRFPTYFWIYAWKRGDVGIWKEYGSTSLTFLEYLLIGVASDLFPSVLLNNEGVNRS
jgi:hypothetical protein